MTLFYAPRALRDLQSIADYLRPRSPAGSRNVMAAIRKTIEKLEKYLELGRLVSE